VSDRREMTGGLAPLALLVGAAALAVGAFFLLFKQVEEEVDAQPRGLAAQNPWYAMERLLGDLGVPTSSRYGLGQLPPSDHVIVLLTTNDAQRGPLAERLSGWVAAGGHLVLAPAEATPEPSLFSLFGDEPSGAGSDGDSGAADPEGDDSGAPPLAGSAPPADGGSDTAAPAEDGALPQDALLDDLGVLIAERWVGGVRARVEVQSPRVEALRALRVQAVPTVVIWSEPTYLPDDGQDLEVWHAASPQIEGAAYGAVVRPLGAGRVTLLPEADLLRSEHIDELDHAVFLVDLLTDRGAMPAGALLVLSGDAPSISGLLWRAGWPALISLFALTLAWAWRSAMPFGPRLPDAPRDRRSLLEHVEATGHFLWRHDHHGALLSAARGRLRDRLSRRHPGLAKLDDEALAVAIAERLDLDPEETRAALTGGGGRDRRAFLAAVRALQRTWRRA